MRLASAVRCLLPSRATSRAIALLTWAAATQAAAQPQLRQPTGKWVVDYGETSCTAARRYGTAEQPVTLAFRPSPDGNVVRLMVARPGRVPSPYHFPVTTTVTSEKAKTTGLRFASTDKKLDIIWINFQRAALEGLPQAGEIVLKSGRELDERFVLPGIAAVLKALDRCNADLRKHWNADEAAAAALSKVATPVKPLHRVVSNTDYPRQAMMEGASGLTRIMMMIDETGTLKDCMVVETSGIATLDAMSCGLLLERAGKFNPALDAAGKPVKSVYTAAFRWVVPPG